MKEFIMGAATPAAVYSPAMTLEIMMWVWLVAGMLFATISLMVNHNKLGDRRTSVIIASWCVLSIVSPGVVLWRMCKPSDKGDE